MVKAFATLVARMAWTCFLVGFSSPAAQAGTPHLVRDINTLNVTVSSTPGDFADQGAYSFFDANDGVHGSQPWLTNGTASGTFMWADVSAPGTGVTGLQPLLAGGKSYILYQDPGSQNTTLWVTDGTQQGSHTISTLTPASAGVNADSVGAYQGLAVFTFFNTATDTRDLWLSDGTAAGTQRVQSASGAAFSVGSTVSINGKIYFMSRPGSTPDELWMSDGTSAGTSRVAQVPNAVQDPVVGSTLVAVGHYLLFNANTTTSGRELWSFDLSTNTLAQVTDIAPGAASGLPYGTFWQTGGVVLFAGSVTGDTNVTLWRSDGTAAGTYSISTVTPAGGFQSYTGGPNTTVGVFQANTAGGTQQLWGTDGTAAGTQLLSTAGGGYPVYLIGGHFYFWTYTSQVAQLWTTDGTTAGTHALGGLPSVPANNNTPQMAGTADTIYVRFRNAGNAGASVIRYDLSTSTSTLLVTDPMTVAPLNVLGMFSYAQGHLYFDNEDPVHGREPWISDGTIAGTTLLKNVAQETQTQASNPADFTAFNGRLYFTADDGVTGREVWYSDGTAAGTSELKDINPGSPSSSPSHLFVANGALYFFAIDGTGTSHLWRSDGTTAGTQPLGAVAARTSIDRGTAGCDSKGVPMGGSIYFAGSDNVNGTQLWKTDGTAAGTVMVTSPATSTVASPRPCYLAATSNRLYFQDNPSFGSFGSELWVSDGTTAGTARVADINPGVASSAPRFITSFNDHAFFLANDGTHGIQLWTSDGTAAGTSLVTTLGASVPQSLQAQLGGRLALTAINSSSGLHELWTSDGTAAGTTKIANNLSSTAVFLDRNLAYYAARALVSGYQDVEPWVSDGTTAGTFQLSDINPSSGSVPDSFTDFNGVVVFQATATDNTRQLWQTNGSATGTQVIATISTSAPRLAAGQNLFFVNNDGTTGNELWALNNQQPLAAADTGGDVTAGSSIIINVLSNDSDPDGSLNPASVVIATPPAHGTATASATGVVTYTAATGYTGPDTFNYTIADNQGFVSNPATVTVNVTAPAPPASSGSGSSSTGSGHGGGGALSGAELALLALATLAAKRRSRLSKPLPPPPRQQY